MSQHAGAALASAEAQVAAARDDPAARLALIVRTYHGPTGRAPRHLPFRRAALSFMRWQVNRGVLNPLDASPPGSVWWRAVNERLLRDGCESVALVGGLAGEPSSRPVRLWLEFIANPTGRNWYRAHNASIVDAYLEHRDLAKAESPPERFFMNVALVRVLYAHALVGAPRLALGRFAPLAHVLGDPRLGMAGVFLSLRRVLPNRYPLALDVRALCRRGAASRPAARLRRDRAAVATHVRVVRRGARRATPARAGSRRQPDLRMALRRATRVALPAHATGRAGARTRHQGPVRAQSERWETTLTTVPLGSRSMKRRTPHSSSRRG